MENDWKKSPYYQSLNGTWKFHWVNNPADRPEEFYKPEFNANDWDNTPVPSNWELEGYGIPIYVNHPYEFADVRTPNTELKNGPEPSGVPHDYNPVASYRRTFQIPQKWDERRVFIHFGAVKSAMYIWVNRDTTLLNNAISSGYFSRIHASSRIAYKADDVHAGGVSYFSSHPIESQTDWDSVKNHNIDGVSTDKPDVTLYVIDNEIPTCSIKNPVNGAGFIEGATITIKVNVGDTDSSITKVEFYRNGSLIGQDTSSPYTYSWSDVTEGSYLLTAKVFDNGMSKISVPVTINVK